MGCSDSKISCQSNGAPNLLIPDFQATRNGIKDFRGARDILLFDRRQS